MNCSQQNYNAKIADIVTQNYYDMIDKEDQIIRGSGAYTPHQRPLSILGCQQPPCETTINDMKNVHSMTGGKFSIGKTISSIGKSVSKTANSASKIVEPVAKQAISKVAPITSKAISKVANSMADKAVNSMINSMSNANNSSVVEGEGMVQKASRPRGRPKKVQQGSGIKRGRPKKGGVMRSQEPVPVCEIGGSFLSSLKKVGSTIAHGVTSAVTNKAIDMGVNALTKMATNPGVDEMAMGEGMKGKRGNKKGGDVKKKRAPSHRNLVIGGLMKKGLSMAQANTHYKNMKK